MEERVAYHEAMLTFLHWRQDIEAWRANADARQDALEARYDALEGRVEVAEGQIGDIARVIPEMMEKLGSQPLSPPHQAAIQRGVTLLHDQLGVPHAVIYNELRQTFRVGKYDQIPDARWPEVVAWFRLRIQAAERRTGAASRDNPFAEEYAEQGSLF